MARGARSGRYSTRLRVAVAFLLVALVALAPSAHAGELGHYFPGAFNIRDYILPDKGVYAAVYSIYYGSTDLRAANGNQISSVNLAGRPVSIDTDLNLYSVIPTVLWNSGRKILGAEYGAYGGVPFGGPSLGVALGTQTGFGVQTDTSAFGLQDLFVQPLWLRWKWKDADLAAAYGFYAPSGRFEPGKADSGGSAAAGAIVGTAAGCVSTSVGGVASFNCGGVFYRPFYQNNQVVYQVVSAP